MTRISLAAALAVAAALQAIGPACAQDDDPGKVLAQTYCGRCHAIGETGDSPFKDAPPFREVVKRYPVANLAEALAEGIVVGHDAMPEFSFSPEQIEDLLTYLDSLKK